LRHANQGIMTKGRRGSSIIQRSRRSTVSGTYSKHTSSATRGSSRLLSSSIQSSDICRTDRQQKLPSLHFFTNNYHLYRVTKESPLPKDTSSPSLASGTCISLQGPSIPFARSFGSRRGKQHTGNPRTLLEDVHESSEAQTQKWRKLQVPMTDVTASESG
jgi:hypothetical protein